ncbi:MAG: hypothetical protein ABI579_02695 [Candidatus Sumerlaeota bacterium]
MSIPEDVRRGPNLHPGDQVRVVWKNGNNTVDKTENPMLKYRGMFKSANITFERETDRAV